MKRPLLFALALGAVCPAAQAQNKADSPVSSGYYSCRDANGRLLTSDRPIMECMNREQKVHNADGTLRRVIEAPLTAEQKRQREEEKARKEAEQERAEQERRRDQILLSSYSSVAAIEQARARPGRTAIGHRKVASAAGPTREGTPGSEHGSRVLQEPHAARRSGPQTARQRSGPQIRRRPDRPPA